MSPLLFLGASGIYLPPGDNLAGFQPVDWAILAAIQLLISPQAESSRVPHRAIWFSNVCFQSAHDMFVSACLCTVCVDSKTLHWLFGYET